MAKGAAELSGHDQRLTMIRIFGVRLRQLGATVNPAVQTEASE